MIPLQVRLEPTVEVPPGEAPVEVPFKTDRGLKRMKQLRFDDNVEVYSNTCRNESLSGDVTHDDQSSDANIALRQRNPSTNDVGGTLSAPPKVTAGLGKTGYYPTAKIIRGHKMRCATLTTFVIFGIALTWVIVNLLLVISTDEKVKYWDDSKLLRFQPFGFNQGKVLVPQEIPEKAPNIIFKTKDSGDEQNDATILQWVERLIGKVTGGKGDEPGNKENTIYNDDELSNSQNMNNELPLIRPGSFMQPYKIDIKSETNRDPNQSWKDLDHESSVPMEVAVSEKGGISSWEERIRDEEVESNEEVSDSFDDVKNSKVEIEVDGFGTLSEKNAEYATAYGRKEEGERHKESLNAPQQPKWKTDNMPAFAQDPQLAYRDSERVPFQLTDLTPEEIHLLLLSELRRDGNVPTLQRPHNGISIASNDAGFGRRSVERWANVDNEKRISWLTKNMRRESGVGRDEQHGGAAADARLPLRDIAGPMRAQVEYQGQTMYHRLPKTST